MEFNFDSNVYWFLSSQLILKSLSYLVSLWRISLVEADHGIEKAYQVQIYSTT